MMRENGGWECFTMIVIKEYPSDNKMEARIEEDKVMREMNAPGTEAASSPELPKEPGGGADGFKSIFTHEVFLLEFSKVLK
jgi:hypothetical protein